MSSQSNKHLIGAGLFAAFASSLCCIVPLIAAIASLSGVAGNFLWIEPIRPFLIGFTVIILGYAWYRHLKIKSNKLECDCDNKNSTILQSSKFLWIATIFAVLMLTFPYYSSMFFIQSGKENIVVAKENIEEAKLQIEGMTCSSCEHHVNKSLIDHKAVIEASSSFESGLAIVKYDKSRTSIEELSKVVETETGYKVINQETIN